MEFEQELRLLWAVVLNAAVLSGAYALARRCSNDWVRRFSDTLLLTFLVQYLAVMVPGLLHLLSPASITVAAGLLVAALIVGSKRLAPVVSMAGTDESPHPTPLVLMGFLMVIGWLGVWCYLIWLAPPTVYDVLVYHLPAAVKWLLDGRISLFEVWFFNPANTYSPLAGSAMIVWWLAPFHHDLLARFVQMPSMLLIFLSTVLLIRSVGVSNRLAMLVAVALTLSRALLVECTLDKDDLYLAAFFTTALAACERRSLSGRAGAIRLGIALGLMLAIKYTALLSLPIFLLLFPWSKRNGWRPRHLAGMVLPVLLLGFPWYLRNWILTGNPVFPIDVNLLGHTLFRGILTIERNETLRTLKGIGQVLTGTYFSVPVTLAVAMAGGWAIALLTHARRLLSEPMVRAVLIGPVVALLLFIFRSPYAEVRFIFPALVLLAAAVALALQWIDERHARWLATALAVGFLVCSLATSHAQRVFMVEGTLAGLVLAGVGYGLWRSLSEMALTNHRRAMHFIAGLTVLVGIMLVGMVYVGWTGTVNAYKAAYDPEDSTQSTFWQHMYIEAGAWRFIREKTPTDATIAYANTPLVYPLLGFQWSHKAVYVSPRPGFSHWPQLPHLPGKVSGERIWPLVIGGLNADPDEPTWLQRLHQSGAEFLLVIKRMEGVSSPEIAMAAHHPDRFTNVYEDQTTIVYRIQDTR